ncbi:TPA: hypothetical protein ACGU2D_003280 [Vibrio vulnificus]
MEVSKRCFLCGIDEKVYSYRDTFFCRECIARLNDIISEEIVTTVDHKLLELIIFLTFDLELTRRSLNAITDSGDVSVIHRKVAAIDAVDISNFQSSRILKEKVDDLLKQHRLLLSLYLL